MYTYIRIYIKYMYINYFVHLVGIKRSDWLQNCTVYKASTFNDNCFMCWCITVAQTVGLA